MAETQDTRTPAPACCGQTVAPVKLTGVFRGPVPTLVLALRSKTAGRRRRWNAHSSQHIAQDAWLEIELMMLAFAAGISDATTFPDYRVFASNQTGNTALLAVGALRLVSETSLDLRNVGVSLASFVVGGCLLGQLGHRFGCTRRSWLLVTNFFQTALVATAAVVRWQVATDVRQPSRYAVIACLAFASGAQVAMARTVNVPEITTAMVTSAYIDLLVDPEVAARHNRSRNRRFFFVLALIGGSFVGAAAYRAVQPALSLLLAAACKLTCCVMLFFNRAQSPLASCEDGRKERTAVDHRADM